MIELDVPWWTYSAISQIEAYIATLKEAPVIFEYGSGASTIWLAKRAQKLISIEHDRNWYWRLKNKLSSFSHVKLILCEPEVGDHKKYYSTKMKHVSFYSYVTAIQNFDLTYDIIVIDGRAREACLNEAFKYLKPHGIIILDNSDRQRYQTALKQTGLNLEKCKGRVPGSPFKGETALLRKEI